MTELAYLLGFVLAALALLHLSWAFGSTWPRRSETDLARTVVGSRGIERMPPRLATGAVAICLSGAAVWALMLREVGPVALNKYIILAGGAALAAVFFFRGVIGILPYFERLAPEEPFLTLNRRLYSPLCLAIGLSFALLVAAWPNWSWRFGL